MRPHVFAGFADARTSLILFELSRLHLRWRRGEAFDGDYRPGGRAMRKGKPQNNDEHRVGGFQAWPTGVRECPARLRVTSMKTLEED